MSSFSRRKRLPIFLAVGFVSILACSYYLIFPGWVKKQIDNLSIGSKEPFIIAVEKIHATGWPIGLGLKNISIQQLSSDSTITDSLFIRKLTIEHFNLFSFLFHKKYNVGQITLDHLTGEWSLPPKDTTKSESVFPFHSLCRTIIFKNVNLTLKKKDSSQETILENGNLTLKHVLVEKDSLLSSVSYQISDINLATANHVSSDSLYSFRAHHILYSDRDSTLRVDSFFSLPNYENYAFARMHPFQTDRVYAAFKHIAFNQCELNTLISNGDIRVSSIHADSFLLDIFRDRRRPFLHKTRPLYQDLLYSYPGVLSIDSITALHGKIIFTEYGENAPEAGKIWFTDVSTTLSHLYNDPTLQMKNDSFIVFAEALAMGKGNVSFTSTGYLFDPQNTFYFSGLMEKVSVAAFNPILRPNAGMMSDDGYVNGIYFNFVADNNLAKGDMLFNYSDLLLHVVDKETGLTKGFLKRLLTKALDVKILDANPLPNDTLRHGAILFERDPEKMYFSYMLKSIFSGIKSSVEE